MNHTKSSLLSWRELLPFSMLGAMLLFLLALAVRPSQAAVGDLTFTIEGPVVQNSQVTCNAGLVVETFNSLSAGAVTTVDLATGTYDQGSGPVIIAPADDFGGVSGIGNYIRTDIPGSYRLTIDTTAFPQGAGYVGFWWSAGDGENTVTVNMADGSSQTFDTQTILDSGALVGTPGVYGGHFGNPNLPNVNPDEVYAFVNIFAANDNARIKSLVFAEKPTGVGSFESDNHSLCADLLDPDTGTEITQPGTITIVKEATPQSEQEFTFVTNIGGSGTQFTLKDNGIDPNFKSFDNLQPATYNFAESTRPAGWKLTNVQCSGGSDIIIGGSNVSINLQAGENVTCTYTNEKVGSITIVKDANPDDGTAFDFDQDIDASGSFSLTHGDSKTFSDVAPATYKISETLSGDWYMSLVNCEAASGNDVNFNIDYVNDYFSVELASGEDVTCTVSNKLFATLTIKKVTVGGDDTFNFTSPFFPVSSFDLTTVGGTAERTFGELPSNVTPYEVNETPQPGWVLTDASCDNGDTPDEVFLAPGDDVTCTFTNVQRNVCPVDDPGVGNELTDLIGRGMGSPTRAIKRVKLVVPDANDLTGLYGQLAAVDIGLMKWTRFSDGSTIQINPPTSPAYRTWAVDWWGTELNPTSPIKAAFFTGKGAARAPRGLVLWPTYQTTESYANVFATFDDSFSNHVYWNTSAGWVNEVVQTIDIPETQAAGADITVKVALVDNQPDDRPVLLTVTPLPGGTPQTLLLFGPNVPGKPAGWQNTLNLETILLENVPAGVNQIEIKLFSPNPFDQRYQTGPNGGDSAAMIGAAASYACALPEQQNP